VPEPRVPELRQLTQAMNTMVARLKLILDAQAQQVETLRREAHSDPVTGLANRQHFMARLAGHPMDSRPFEGKPSNIEKVGAL